MTRSHGAPRYWSLPAPELLAALETRAEGLSQQEAADRLRRDGPNLLVEEQGPSVLGLLGRQLRSPLVLILVFSAIVAAGLREWLEASIILAIVLGSALLGVFQEHRASAAVAELKRRLALLARVRRDGCVVERPFRDIVAGDVVLLGAGAVVPADALLLSAQDLLVGEAVLTGESFPVEKRPGVAPAAASVGQRTNVVFMGSSVLSGAGEAVVVRTGRTTEFGAIAERLRARPIETEFERAMRRFGAMLIRIMTVVVLFVLIVHQLMGRPFLDSLLFAVALGVGMSPELLPAIVSVTLSRGAQRLAAKGVVVRRLEAIENLGAMTVFCTDKTGTLTEGCVRLEAALDAQGRAGAEEARLAFLNAAFQTGIANPLDRAILDSGRATGLDTAGYAKADELPYDFTRKRLSIVVAPAGAPDARLMITKGAFDPVLALCSHWASPDGEAPLDRLARDRIHKLYRRRGEEGFRVLALATRRFEVKPDYDFADETDLCFRGFLVFADPPKPDAATAIGALFELGVAVKIISGDNRHVVGHVAASLGLDRHAMLTGPELQKMKDEALWNRAAQTTLFAEVDPQQKERIVRALKRSGEVVGFLGDGVNDAPALNTADVGVSVDQAVDVARESADIVMLRRDLRVLKLGVEGGRRTFANTLKYISITISANFGNMASMALAAPLLPFLPMAAKQILLNNFLSDLPAMALSSDRVDADQIRRPQRMGIGDIQRFMVVFGLLSSAFDGLVFFLLLKLVRASEAVFQTGWFVFSLLTELAIVLVLRSRGPIWRTRPGGLLLALTAAATTLALVSPYLGVGSAIFGFVPMAPTTMAALLALVLAYAAATEAAKLWFYRSLSHPPRPAPKR
jgi:Mg2+-importing ATPase